MSDFHIPSQIQSLIAGYRLQPVTIGESSARVFHLTRRGQPSLFLKCAAGRDSCELISEAERLRWLANRTSVPEIVAFASDDDSAALVLQALAGCNAVEASRKHPHAVVTGFAGALRALHEQPIAACPFDQRLTIQIGLARQRTRAGLVNEADFDVERQGYRAAELLERIERERPENEDLVLTHGDACLPNLIFDGGRFVGFVDCSRAGVADRYQDLALAARSITSNLGAEWVPLFFESYGVPTPDASKLAYFCLLDEFF